MLAYFQGPGALMSLWFAGVALVLSYRARDIFEPGDSMHQAWAYYGFSCACELFSVVLSEVLTSPGWLNPLRGTPFGSPEFADALRDTGSVLGGLCRYALLACALAYGLKAYRQTGMLARLRRTDHLLLAGVGVYLIVKLFETITTVRDIRPPSLIDALGWPVDPLLWFLLVEALILWRSARAMRGGWIANCWISLTAGVMLAAVGDILLLLGRLGYLPWPYSGLEWYVWLPGSASFALAPAYQLKAVAQAHAVSAVNK